MRFGLNQGLAGNVVDGQVQGAKPQETPGVVKR